MARGDKRRINEKKKSFILHFLGLYVQWRENKIFRERSSNFSLDFSVFGPSVLVEPRSKIVIHGKGYAWTPILWSFDNFER